MIEQELYLELLELFDLVKEEPVFKEYTMLQQQLINSDVGRLISEYNELILEKEKISYADYQQQLDKRLNEIELKLANSEEYQRFQKLYQICNDELKKLAQLILKDIVIVEEVDCSENK